MKPGPLHRARGVALIIVLVATMVVGAIVLAMIAIDVVRKGLA